MPEISRFYGIIIRMFAEAGVSHHAAHFHAYYKGDEVVIEIKTADVLAGSLPRKQLRLVQAWTELHTDELMLDWKALQDGKSPVPIQPLN